MPKLARIWLGFCLLSLPARTADADAAAWPRVIEATERLNAGDFAGAERALSGVPDDDPAAADAALVRQALDRALAPHVTSDASSRTDNLPFDAHSLALELAVWASPRIQLTAGAEALSLRGQERLTAALATGSARARLGAAMLDVSADVAGRYWSDTRALLLGGARAELFPTASIRLQSGAYRDEELGNFAAAQWHVLRDSAFLQVELKDWKRVTATARAEATFYSDRNAALLGYAWATYAVLLSPARIELGYAGAYRDTRDSRWSASAGYFPYMTPMQSLRHGPIASVSVRLPQVELGGAASGALVASERDPSTVGYFELRRNTSYYEARGFLRIGPPHSAVQASYEFLQDGYYYTMHTVRLAASFRL